MPRIINAYDGNSAIGDSLAKLGESIYGDQAKNEVYRQKARSQKNINDLAMTPGTSLDDPRVALGQLANGGAATDTFAGLGRNNASRERIGAASDAAGERNNVRTNAETHYGTDRQYDSNIATTGMNNATSIAVGNGNNDASRDVAHINADKTAASDKYRFDNTPMATYDPASGHNILTPQSQAAGHEAVPTADSLVAGVFRKNMDNQQQQPGQPTGDPLAGVDPRLLHKTGWEMPEQSLVHPASGMTGISRDGGRTVILPNGASIPATGFQPVDQGTALNEARGNVQRAQVAHPLAVPNAVNSQAAANAANTSGIGAKVATIVNDELGALPGGPAVIKAFTGSPQIAPGVQSARQDQDILAQQTRALLAGATGRQTTQAQKWVDELLPQGDAFSNPATEATKVPKIIGALQGDHEQLRQVVQTTADPAERTKALVQMHQIEGLIKKWTAPAAPTAGAQPAAAAPQAAAPQGDPLSQARAAIAAGANPAAVKQRLQQNGINPAGL